MSEGCEGCLISARGMQSQYQTIKAEAKKYAREQKVTVAIYKEGFEYRFALESVAAENGYPVLEFISQYN